MKKKLTTVSEKLNKLFAPEEHSEPSDDETAPKVSEFDETLDEATRTAALSEFRRRNIRFLEDIDRKYKGAVSSRKETFNEDDSDEEQHEEDDPEQDDSGGDDEDDDFGGDDEELSQESEDDEPSYRKRTHKSLVLLRRPQRSEDSDENDDGDSEEQPDEDDSVDDDDLESTDGNDRPHSQSMVLVKEENRQEAINKGLAVQNQLKIWERMLEMRIKVQPCLIAANGLPPANTYETMCSQSEEFRQKASQTVQTVTEAMDRMLQMQDLLLERFPETTELLKSGSKRKAISKASSSKSSKVKRATGLDAYEPVLAGRANDMEPYRNSVLMKWHDRTSVANTARNQKASLSVLKKIEDSLINREELARKTQIYRGGYPLIGRPTVLPSEDRLDDQGDETGERVDRPVYDGEIFDDTDFYHQQLRELIEFKSSTTESPQEIANKLAELQKLRNKMKKNVDTKASKGRKIR